MLKKFKKDTSGVVLIFFALISPVLVMLFAYVNNYAIWNDLYQFTKGASKSATQSLGKQFFSRCVQAGNNIGQCKNAGTISTIATTQIQEAVANQVTKNYPQFNYTVNVTMINAAVVQQNYMQIPVRVTLSGFDDQLMMGGMFGSVFPNEVSYDIQTVINLHFQVN